MKEREVSTFILNRKANAKLDYVVGIFKRSLVGHFEVAHNGFLKKKIRLLNLHNMDGFTMRYALQNRLFARTYDLLFNFRVPSNKETKELELELKYEGKLSVKGAKFVVVKGLDESGITEKLNGNDLLTARLKALDFLKLTIRFIPKEREWDISVTSLIGSAVWNFIPPMFQVIKPREDECVRMIEAFELVAHAVS